MDIAEAPRKRLASLWRSSTSFRSPAAAGNEETNLWLSCADCNTRKGVRTSAIDPLTLTEVTLYNPRQQTWTEHFAWIEGGVLVEGRTPTGRATVAALQLNRDILVTARRVWILSGWHPSVS